MYNNYSNVNKINIKIIVIFSNKNVYCKIYSNAIFMFNYRKIIIINKLYIPFYISLSLFFYTNMWLTLYNKNHN